jgi:hypothetical protein
MSEPALGARRPARTLTAMGQLTRRDRESRAFGLVVATGAGAVATLGLAVLAIFGVVGFGLVILVGIVTAVLGWLFRRAVSA